VRAGASPGERVVTDLSHAGPGVTVRLRPLSMVDEGDDEVVVGDPVTGDFVTIPKVGGVVIEALQGGATVAEAAAVAEEFAGQPVDVPSFVATLRELGFLDEGQEAAPARSAPIQGRRWLAGVRQEAVQPFFGPVAWGFYAACALFALAVFVVRPRLFPNPVSDPFAFSNIGLGALALIPITLSSAALHEMGHWLAARALGVQARFGVDRRAVVLLVFETDLTQIWTVPRRKRYSPLLAGIALDVVLLAAALAVRLPIDAGAWSPPDIVDRLLAAWIYAKLGGLLWQCMVFMRTDLYAVLVNALGCRNLWQVSNLTIRRRLRKLSAAQAAELTDAHPHDLRAARWFQWVRMAGTLAVLAWVGFFLAPFIWELLRWAAGQFAAGPAAGRFWWALLCTAVTLAPLILAVALSAREYLRRLRAWAVRAAVPGA
jgi:putative peptide zinc metalloprotease protein